MSFVHSSAVLWHCFSIVSTPYTCSLLEFYPNRASIVYRTSSIKFSHLLVPSVHCSYMYIPRYRLHITKATMQPTINSPWRTLLFGSSDPFVMTVSTERPHLSQTATTTSSMNFLTSHSCFSLIKLVFRVWASVCWKTVHNSARWNKHQLLGLGSELYPSNIKHMLRKGLTGSMQSLSREERLYLYGEYTDLNSGWTSPRWFYYCPLHVHHWSNRNFLVGNISLNPFFTIVTPYFLTCLN